MNKLAQVLVSAVTSLLLALQAHAWDRQSCAQVNNDRPECVQFLWMPAASISAQQPAAQGAANNSPSSPPPREGSSTGHGGTGGPSTSAAASASQAIAGSNAATGPVTITDQSQTNVRYSFPIQLANIQLPPGLLSSSPALQAIVTPCSLQPQEIVEVNKIDARIVGFFSDTRWNNGAVYTLKPARETPAIERVSEWETVGHDEKGNAVEVRRGLGTQYYIVSYIVGTAGAKGFSLGGVSHSGDGGAGGITSGAAVQTYGNFVAPIPCETREQRTRYVERPPPPPPPPPPSAAGAAAAAAVQLDLSRVPVPGPVVRYQLVDNPTTCNGRPIPEGKRCIPIRKTVNVVDDARIRGGAAAAAGAESSRK